jgi:hypothetical protein
MDTKYIHTEQLLNAKKAIEADLYPLKTFVAWVLFGKKDHISPGIAVIETKGRLLREHYGLSSEEIVARVSRFILASFVQYVNGQKTLKSFLLTNINFTLDRMMSDTRTLKAVEVPKILTTYSERERNSELLETEPNLENDTDQFAILDKIQTKRPFVKSEYNPAVVIRRKKVDPEMPTVLDLYNNAF